MINYIHGIKRSYDYARVRGADNEEEYQAAMVIMRENIPGKSFWVTRDAIWKYVEPKDNADEKTVQSDRMEFQQMLDRNLFLKKMAVTEIQRQRVIGEAACIVFAMALNQSDKIMLCTGYNLAMCMQMFEISPCPAAAAQLLLWIQDGLDHLKNIPDEPPAPDDKIVMGEVTLFEGSRKLGTHEIAVAESDLVMESEETQAG